MDVSTVQTGRYRHYKGKEYTVIGVARHSDMELLRAADADLVVTSLDDVAMNDLSNGRLSRRSA